MSDHQAPMPRLTDEDSADYYKRIENYIMNTLKDLDNRVEVLCPFEECGRRYASKYSLFRHYLVHNPKKEHLCSYCGKKFGLIQYLRDHMNLHTGEKPYKCDSEGCNEAFMQAGRLSHHRKKAHNLTSRRQRKLMIDQPESDIPSYGRKRKTKNIEKVQAKASL